MAIQYSNVSNPAAFGVEWANGDNGSRFQLVNVRGTAGLHFGVKAEGRAQWSQMPVVDPSRFGLTDPPKSFRQFMAVVRAYVEG